MMFPNRVQVPDMSDDFFLAGQRVAPGHYHLVGGQRNVYLDREDTLPATLDGKVAVYVRQRQTWAELQRRNR